MDNTKFVTGGKISCQICAEICCIIARYLYLVLFWASNQKSKLLVQIITPEYSIVFNLDSKSPDYFSVFNLDSITSEYSIVLYLHSKTPEYSIVFNLDSKTQDYFSVFYLDRLTPEYSTVFNLDNKLQCEMCRIVNFIKTHKINLFKLLHINCTNIIRLDHYFLWWPVDFNEESKRSPTDTWNKFSEG